MRKIILLLLASQTLSFSVSATEVENLAPPGNMPVSYFWSKEATSIQLASQSVKNLTNNTDIISNSLMTAHTAPIRVMPQINTRPIFWGVSWGNPKYYSDIIFGLMYWYQNFQYSTYASTITEYLPTKLSHTSYTPIIDTFAADYNPKNVLAEICSVVGAQVDPNTDYFPVYTDIKRGTANYCAYHSAGTCNGVPVQFAFFFNLNDDPGCDPRSPYAPPVGALNSQKPGSVAGISSNYQQSQGLAALANVSAHELVEVITDPAYFPAFGIPYWGGWFDASGAENGDKCAWTFGPSNTGLTAGTVLIGGFDWKLQGEWSNNAQISGTGGYPTYNSKLVGCVTGS